MSPTTEKAARKNPTAELKAELKRQAKRSGADVRAKPAKAPRGKAEKVPPADAKAEIVEHAWDAEAGETSPKEKVKRFKAGAIAIVEERPDGEPLGPQIDEAAKAVGKRIREIKAAKAAAPSGPMTEAEARACVDAICKAVDDVRARLLELHERQGWKALGYDSFAACVSAEFGQSKARLYQQLQAARIELSITADPGAVGSIPERVLRPLKQLDTPEEQRAAYEAAKSTAVDSGAPAPTGPMVEAEVAKIAEAKGKQIDACLRASLTRREGAAGRWAARSDSGLSDAELAAAIADEWGQSFEATTPAPGYAVAGGKSPRFWLGTGEGAATLNGPDLLDRVRELMGVFLPAPAKAGQCLVNGVLQADTPEVARKRAKGLIPADVVPEIVVPEAEAATAPKAVEGVVVEPDDDEWLATLPARAKVSETRRAKFDKQALCYRRIHPAIKTLRASTSVALKAAGDGPVTWQVRRLLRLEHPKDWHPCPPVDKGGCDGTGEVPMLGECPKCKGDGFLIF